LLLVLHSSRSLPTSPHPVCRLLLRRHRRQLSFFLVSLTRQSPLSENAFSPLPLDALHHPASHRDTVPIAHRGTPSPWAPPTTCSCHTPPGTRCSSSPLLAPGVEYSAFPLIYSSPPYQPASFPASPAIPQSRISRPPISPHHRHSL